VRGFQGPAAEVLGVGEEQRRIIAVDNEARNRARVGVVVNVMHPGETGHLAEDRVVWPGYPDQQFDHGDAHGDQDSVQDVENQDACGSHKRDQQLAAPEGNPLPDWRMSRRTGT